MQGMKFAHVSQNPKALAGNMMIKIGTVKAAVGVGRWLLEFQGKGYLFSNVFPAEALDGFAFFDTVAARDAFISELIASNQPVVDLAPVAEPKPITEAPPEVARGP
jgi:hypothetical protein